MTLEDMVEKIFSSNPNLKEEEAIKKLKEMKDPKTKKVMWKAATIRNRVNTYVRKNRGDTNILVDESNKPPVEIKEFGSNGDNKTIEEPIQEGKGQIKDPFAIEQTNSTDVGKIVDQMKDEENTVDIDELKMELFDSISQKVSEQVSDEMKSFKERIVGIVGDLKTSVVNKITDIKNDIKNMQSHNITTYEPVIEYDDIKLKKTTITSIKDIVEERELNEESDFIDSLIDCEKEYLSVMGIYNKLIDLAKEAKNGVLLRLFYENDKLSYNKKTVGRLGINPKNLIAGIAIGIAIGITIVLIYHELTTVVPIPTPIP